jgi:hypothetical protein
MANVRAQAVQKVAKETSCPIKKPSRSHITRTNVKPMAIMLEQTFFGLCLKMKAKQAAPKNPKSNE